MPRNGQGVYELPDEYGNPAEPHTPILAENYNGTMNDLAEGLTNSLSRDGQGAMNGNLDMGNNKLINVSDPTGENDVANKSTLIKSNYNILTSISSTNPTPTSTEIIATPPHSSTGLNIGLEYAFIVTNENVGATTIKIGSLDAKSIKLHGNVELSAGSIKVGGIAVIKYNGSYFELMNRNITKSDAVFIRMNSYYQITSIQRNGTHAQYLFNGDKEVRNTGNFAVSSDHFGVNTDSNSITVPKSGTYVINLNFTEKIFNTTGELTYNRYELCQYGANGIKKKAWDINTGGDEYFDIVYPKNYNFSTVMECQAGDFILVKLEDQFPSNRNTLDTSILNYSVSIHLLEQITIVNNGGSSVDLAPISSNLNAVSNNLSSVSSALNALSGSSAVSSSLTLVSSSLSSVSSSLIVTNSTLSAVSSQLASGGTGISSIYKNKQKTYLGDSATDYPSVEYKIADLVNVSFGATKTIDIYGHFKVYFVTNESVSPTYVQTAFFSNIVLYPLWYQYLPYLKTGYDLLGGNVDSLLVTSNTSDNGRFNSGVFTGDGQLSRLGSSFLKLKNVTIGAGVISAELWISCLPASSSRQGLSYMDFKYMDYPDGFIPTTLYNPF